MDGSLPLATLEEALVYLQQKHPMLLCQTIKEDGKYYFETNPGMKIPVEYITDVPSFQNSSDPEFAKVLDRLVNNNKKYRPDTTPSGPLLKLVFVNPTPTENHLIFVTHHGIADGYRVAVLFNDLMEIVTQLPNPIDVHFNFVSFLIFR